MEEDLEQFIYKPLVWLFRICNGSPFKRRMPNILPCDINVDSILTVLTVCVTGSASVYYAFYSEYSPLGSEPNVKNILYYGCTIAWLTAPLAFQIQNHFKRDRYMAIWSDLLRLGRQLRCNNHMRMQEALFLAFVFQYVANTILQVHTFGPTVMAAAVMVVSLEYLVPKLQCLLVIGFAKSGFSALNSHLEDLKNSPRNRVEIMSSSMAEQLLLHTRLRETAMKINSHFGFYILSNVFITLGLTVIMMYRVFHSIRSENNVEVTFITILQIIQFTFGPIILMITAILSHACSKEAKRTVLIAHSMVNSDGSTSLQIMEQVEQFSLAMIGSEVQNMLNFHTPDEQSFAIIC